MFFSHFFMKGEMSEKKNRKKGNKQKRRITKIKYWNLLACKHLFLTKIILTNYTLNVFFKN